MALVAKSEQTFPADIALDKRAKKQIADIRAAIIACMGNHGIRLALTAFDGTAAVQRILKHTFYAHDEPIHSAIVPDPDDFVSIISPSKPTKKPIAVSLGFALSDLCMLCMDNAYPDWIGPQGAYGIMQVAVAQPKTVITHVWKTRHVAYF